MSGDLCAAIYQNGYQGIFVKGPQAAPLLQRNVCEKNGKNGIYFSNKAQGRAIANVCTHNKNNGIYIVGDGTTPVVRDNRLTDNHYQGLWYPMGARIKLLGNEFSRNAYICEQLARHLFHGRRFKELDEIAAHIRDNNIKEKNGYPRLSYFYRHFTKYCEEMDAKQEQNYLRRLETWRGKFPDSITWRVLLAESYKKLAWRERGGSWASEVTSAGWKGFRSYLNKAWDIIEEARDSGKTDPELYAVAVEVALGLNMDTPSGGALFAATVKSLVQGEDSGEVWNTGPTEELFDAGFALDPLYFPLYGSRAMTLVPRWGGTPDAPEAFAAQAAQDTKELVGDGMYTWAAYRTRACWTEHWRDIRTRFNFSWPRVSQGCKDLSAYFDDDNYYLNLHATFACAFAEREEAAALFKTIGDDWNESIWMLQDKFGAWRAWALDDGPMPDSGEMEDAIGDGDEAKVRRLLAAGQDPSGLTNDGLTMLYLAITYGEYGVAKILLEGGADVLGEMTSGMSPTLCALRKKNYEAMTLLLEHGLDINAPISQGRTPLVVAILERRSYKAKRLLKEGADPNLHVEGLWPPLCLAVNYKLPTVVADMIANGAKKDATTSGGWSCTHLAAYHGDVATMRVLLNNGFDTKTALKDGRTPRAIAQAGRHTEVVKLLDGYDAKTSE